jgi:hypothetical protein
MTWTGCTRRSSATCRCGHRQPLRRTAPRGIAQPAPGGAKQSLQHHASGSQAWMHGGVGNAPLACTSTGFSRPRRNRPLRPVARSLHLVPSPGSPSTGGSPQQPTAWRGTPRQPPRVHGAALQRFPGPQRCTLLVRRSLLQRASPGRIHHRTSETGLQPPPLTPTSPILTVKADGPVLRREGTRDRAHGRDTCDAVCM